MKIALANPAGEGFVVAVALGQSAYDQVRMDEGGAARTIHARLEGAGVDSRAALQHQRMVGAEQGEQVIEVGRDPRPKGGGVDQLEGAEDIVRVFEAPLRRLAPEDDLLRFLQLEFGALDPVREIEVLSRGGALGVPRQRFARPQPGPVPARGRLPRLSE